MKKLLLAALVALSAGAASAGELRILNYAWWTADIYTGPGMKIQQLELGQQVSYYEYPTIDLYITNGGDWSGKPDHFERPDVGVRVVMIRGTAVDPWYETYYNPDPAAEQENEGGRPIWIR